MTGAELKTLREACGLAVPHLAALAGVQERTARYWESGRSAVPADVAEAITRIDAQLTLGAEQAREQVQRIVDDLGPPADPVILVRYQDDADLHHYHPDMASLPAASHAAMLDRTRRALAELGVRVEIHYLDAGAYERWRRAERRADNAGLRAEFAARGLV